MGETMTFLANETQPVGLTSIYDRTNHGSVSKEIELPCKHLQILRHYAFDLLSVDLFR